MLRFGFFVVCVCVCVKYKEFSELYISHTRLFQLPTPFLFGLRLPLPLTCHAVPVSAVVLCAAVITSEVVALMLH